MRSRCAHNWTVASPIVELERYTMAHWMSMRNARTDLYIGAMGALFAWQHVCRASYTSHRQPNRTSMISAVAEWPQHLLWFSSMLFCRFNSSMSCWCDIFFWRMNVIYSAAFFKICARLAYRRRTQTKNVIVDDGCWTPFRGEWQKRRSYIPLSRPATMAPNLVTM